LHKAVGNKVIVISPYGMPMSDEKMTSVTMYSARRVYNYYSLFNTSPIPPTDNIGAVTTVWG